MKDIEESKKIARQLINGAGFCNNTDISVCKVCPCHNAIIHNSRCIGCGSSGNVDDCKKRISLCKEFLNIHSLSYNQSFGIQDRKQVKTYNSEERKLRDDFAKIILSNLGNSAGTMSSKELATYVYSVVDTLMAKRNENNKGDK